MSARMFPVITDQSRLPRAERALWPAAIPCAIVEPWRAQAERNHCGQTLERLAERHGLSPGELWCAAHGRDLRAILNREITESAAGAWLVAIVANHPTSSESSP